MRRTKIIATLGPATDAPKVLDRMIETGVDVVRLNLSHGGAEVQRQRAAAARERAQAYGCQLGMLVDLQGPKIRIGQFREGAVTLAEGERFVLSTELALTEGSRERVGVTYKALANDLSPGAVLLLDDGRIVLEVQGVEGADVVCRVASGGELAGGKGINRQGGGLSAPALTEKDQSDISLAAEIEADYLGVSFPRSAADIEEARRRLRAAGGHGGIVAKIERAEAVTAIEEIVASADAVMMARGDLGVELGDAALPRLQKHIIRLAREMNKVTITATQMMESMIEHAMPTRAEVSDVANAVLDGTDAVMLSAESAIGKHPVAAVAAMDRVCREAEKEPVALITRERRNVRFQRVDEAIALAVMYTANHMPARAIAALTESGATALWMSRIGSAVPIYAMTPHVRTQRKVTLYRNVYPVAFEQTSNDPAEIMREAIEELRRREAVREGDLVIFTIGEPLREPGGTNSMKLIRVPAQPA